VAEAVLDGPVDRSFEDVGGRAGPVLGHRQPQRTIRRRVDAARVEAGPITARPAADEVAGGVGGDEPTGPCLPIERGDPPRAVDEHHPLGVSHVEVE